MIALTLRGSQCDTDEIQSEGQFEIKKSDTQTEGYSAVLNVTRICFARYVQEILNREIEETRRTFA